MVNFFKFCLILSFTCITNAKIDTNQPPITNHQSPKIDLEIFDATEQEKKQDNPWILVGIEQAIPGIESDKLDGCFINISNPNTNRKYNGRIEKNPDGSYLAVFKKQG